MLLLWRFFRSVLFCGEGRSLLSLSAITRRNLLNRVGKNGMARVYTGDLSDREILAASFSLSWHE